MKCICHNILMEEIVFKAKRKNLKTLDEIIEQIDCGKKCKLCHPFIEEIILSCQN